MPDKNVVLEICNITKNYGDLVAVNNLNLKIVKGEYKDRDVDIEMCESVTEMKQDIERLKFREIDRVENTACVLHKGSYNKLREAYNLYLNG